MIVFRIGRDRAGGWRNATFAAEQSDPAPLVGRTVAGGQSAIFILETLKTLHRQTAPRPPPNILGHLESALRNKG